MPLPIQGPKANLKPSTSTGTRLQSVTKLDHCPGQPYQYDFPYLYDFPVLLGQSVVEFTDELCTFFLPWKINIIYLIFYLF